MNFAVVPAAGRSTRLGRPKALLPFGNSCVLDAVLTTLESSGIERLVVVVAPGEDRLIAHCEAGGYPIAVNERVAEGMLASYQCGLESLDDHLAPTDALTLCPMDFPTLRVATVEALLACLHTSTEGIVVPRFEGRRGHPLVLSAALVSDIERHDLDEGLRGLLGLHPYRQLEVDDPGVHRDLDTWMDYLADSQRPQPIPTPADPPY